MAPTSTFAAFLAIAASVAAQTTTLDLPFYGYDTQSIVASVVAVRSSITTIQLACPAGEEGDDTECGLGFYQTLTVGPSTYNMYISDADFTMTQDCNTADNVCMESAGGSSANFPGVSTTTYDQTDVETFAVTVTAGANLLGAAAGAGAVTTRPIATTTDGVALITGTSTTESVILVSGSSSTVSHSGTSSRASAATTPTTGAAAATAVPALMAAGAGLMGLFL